MKRKLSVKSGNVARNRLESVMLQEHLNIPPQLIEMMKKDVLSALQKYIKVKEQDFVIKWSRTGETEGEEHIEVTARILVESLSGIV